MAGAKVKIRPMEPEDIGGILEVDRKINGVERALTYRDLVREALIKVVDSLLCQYSSFNITVEYHLNVDHGDVHLPHDVRPTHDVRQTHDGGHNKDIRNIRSHSRSKGSHNIRNRNNTLHNPST